jgi:hypothetical protein
MFVTTFGRQHSVSHLNTQPAGGGVPFICIGADSKMCCSITPVAAVAPVQDG